MWLRITYLNYDTCFNINASMNHLREGEEPTWNLTSAIDCSFNKAFNY